MDEDVCAYCSSARIKQIWLPMYPYSRAIIDDRFLAEGETYLCLDCGKITVNEKKLKNNG